MGMTRQKQKNIQKRHRHQIGHPHGFTLVEIIVVIVIIAILAAVAIPSLVGYIDKSHRTHDLISLRTLNMGTKLYRINEQIQTADVFEGISGNPERQNKLLSVGYIEEIMVPRAKSNYFVWDNSMQIWCGASTPFGRPFESVTDAMTSYYETTNVYGPTWGGDVQYSNIGLDPEKWKDKPIDHIYYTPIGSRLQIKPETGYKIEFDFISGGSGTLKSGGWNLIYNLLDSTWYHRSIEEGNQIDINSLEVVQD